MKGKDLKRLLEIKEDLHMLGFEAELNSWRDNQEERIIELGKELIKISNEMNEMLSEYSATKNVRYMVRHNTRETKF